MSNIIKVLKTTLKGNLSTTATTFTVQKFVDSKDVEVVDADFDGNFVVVITQGTNIEMILCSGITQSGSDDTAILAVATNGRHLNPKSPWTGGVTGILFTTGASIVATNDPYTMSRLANIDHANTWALLQSFTIMPQSSDLPTVGADLINKTYADALVLGALTTINVVVPATAGATIASGNLVYYDTTAKEWLLCDADTASTVENVMLAIAQGAGTDGNAITGGVLLRGVDSKQTGMTAGDTMYAGNTAGAIANSAGTKEVVLGIAKSATNLYFNPRFNQMLTEDEQDALAGTSGTPSATNKYVTNDDTAENTASKVVRRKSNSNITVPTTPTASTDASSKNYVETYVDAEKIKVNEFIASDNLKQSADTERSQTGGIYAKVKEIRVKMGGIMRIKFDLKDSVSVGSNPSYGRIYIDGVAVGTEQTISSTTYTTFSEDITKLSGEYFLVQLYIHGSGASGSTGYTKNFRIYYDVAQVADTTVVTD